MKRFTFYFLVSLTAHIIGVSGVLITSFLSTISIIPHNSVEVKEDFQPVPIVAFENKSPKSLNSLPKFIPMVRGCGNGYNQVYQVSDEQWLDEGVTIYPTTKETRAKLNKWIAQATQIIERVPNYKNRFGDLGERIVIVNPLNEVGKESISILWYGGKNSVSYIDAPTLELALEFERTNAYAY